jgi:hypothetical protein
MLPEAKLLLSSLLTLFFGGFVGWFFKRKSENAKAKSLEIDNEVKLSKYYKELLDDLGRKYKEEFKEVTSLFQSKENILKDEILILNRKVKMLTQENKALKATIKKMQNGSNQ